VNILTSSQTLALSEFKVFVRREINLRVHTEIGVESCMVFIVTSDTGALLDTEAEIVC
jgi:hypothetical protein